MEKQDELKAFARMCVQGLSDDVELRQERETELLVHLKSAFAEERQNASDDEALKNTFKRFGDPEEISSQLIDGNTEQLSRNARIRRAAKWLLLPLLIIGVLLCIDVRGILASAALLQTMRPSWFFGRQKSFLDWGVGLKTRKLSDDEQSLFDYYYGKPKTPALELLARLYDAHPDDAMICALYAQELSLPLAGIQERLPEVIANGRRIDPDNPLYDYLECLMLMREGCYIPIVSDMQPDESTIQDRSILDKAIIVYRHGLSKGVINTHGDDLLQKIRSMLQIKKDLLGGMQLIDFRAREKLPFVSSCRSIAKGLVLYCDLLNKEGDNKKAVELLATWRIFTRQFLNNDFIHWLDIQTVFLYSIDFLKCAEKLDATEEIAALQTVMDIRKAKNALVLTNVPFVNAGGVLAGMALAFPKLSDDFSEWSNERRLEAATFDTATIGLGCLCLLFVIALLGVDILVMRIGGRRPFLFIMPRSAYTALLIKGMLFPTLIYFVMTYFIAGKGGLGVVLVVVPIAYLCLVWPLYYGMCWRRVMNKWTRSIGAGSHESFKTSRSFNMLCLFVVLLLFFGCVLRPISKWREHHYADKETLVILKDGEEVLEDKYIQRYKYQLLDQLNDAINRN